MRRLDQGGIVPQDGYLQIPTILFERIAARTDRPEHWAALCRVDEWADGAWGLEMRGAAFDALARNPAAFAERYLKGDDCALLLLTYAYGWALQAADVQGVDCADGGRKEIEEYQQVINSADKAILGNEAPPGGAAIIRRGVLIEVLGWAKDDWAATRARLEEGCSQAPEMDPP